MVTIVLTKEQAQWLHVALTGMVDLLVPEDIPQEICEYISDILQQLEHGGA
jgi:hypothetical protein